MKFGVLKSIGHNLADSFACGNGFLIGLCFTEIYKEAAQVEEGFITVDFLTGTVTGGKPSLDLIKSAMLHSEEALNILCAKQSADPSAFAVLAARFGTDQVYGPHFTVIVEDHKGRRSEDLYVGFPGKKVKRYSHSPT